MKVTFIYNNGKTFSLPNVVTVEPLLLVKGIATAIGIATLENAKAEFKTSVPSQDLAGLELLMTEELSAARSIKYVLSAADAGLTAVAVERGPAYGDEVRSYEIIPFRTFTEGETPVKFDEVIDGVIWSQGLTLGLHQYTDNVAAVEPVEPPNQLATDVEPQDAEPQA